MIAEPPAPPKAPGAGSRQGDRAPSRYRRRLWIAAGAALVIHAALWCFSDRQPQSGIQFGVSDLVPTIDVELVDAPAAPAAPAVASPEPTPPTPEPPKPEPERPPPVPEPVPEPPKPEEPMTAKAQVEVAKPESALPDKPVATPPPPKKSVPSASTESKPATSARSRPSAAAQGTPGGTASGAGQGRATGPAHLFNPSPNYPPESRQAGEQGVVMLKVTVEPNGRPSGISLARSSGFPRLDRAAQEAVRRWRFKPAMRDGQPLSATVTVPVRFSLR